jgi:hypothetical protein
MSWEDILKIQILEQDVKFDADESCCSQLKTEFSMFIEKLVDYPYVWRERWFGSIIDHYFPNSYHLVRILEEPCEEVVATIMHMIDEVKKSPKDSNSFRNQFDQPTWALTELEKMIDNFEKCTGDKAQ